MDRRAVLATLGSGAAALPAGCLAAVVNAPEPVHFELWNRTDSAHEVAVTIRDGAGEVVLERTYDVEDASAGSPGGNVIREEAFAEATNDSVFPVAATLDQRATWEHRFRVTCSGRESENVFLAEITPGREVSLTFSQSLCS